MTDSPFDDALGASYRLTSRLGEGASGEVWLAVDTRSGENVAAKLLRAEHVADTDLVARFVTERSLLVGLRDPGIVAVRDLVVEGDRLAIVMDYVDGGSVRGVLRTEATLSPNEAACLTAEVLGALQHAHGRGIVHRDVKPDNVLLTRAWRTFAPGTARLTDFGIARILQESGQATTGLIGTPEYMSPELFTTGECGFPTDVYGAGILLYELLAGRTPFAGPGNDFTVAQRHVTARPPELAVPGDLWSLLAQLLAKDPGARPSAAAAAEALRRIAPMLAGLPALPKTSPPGEFERVVAATVVRGLAAPAAEPEPVLASQGPLPELGRAPQETVLRAQPRVVAPSRPANAVTAPKTVEVPPWRNPKVLGALAGALLLMVGAALLFIRLNPGGATTTTQATTVKATQADRPTPTGLTTSRVAEFDPHTQLVRLTITYSAQNAPLGGPFLEVLPGVAAADGCPRVRWSGAAPRPNLPSTTGITAACAWSVPVDQVAAQGIQTVTADLAIPAIGQDPQTALQAWLDGAAAATASALGDRELSSPAYPVQRLQGVQVIAPDRITTGRSLPLVLLPVWPSGPDSVNLLYRSPSAQAPTSMLVAIAGGTSGVRFSDGCAGGVKVSADGLAVTTLTLSTSCSVNAQVGNFSGLSSNAFAIVTRG